MPYQVKILADSVAPSGKRLTTFQLKYPRYIHAEMMTHRQFSRNASSSRAIPIDKMIEWIEKDPAVPIYWGSKKKGMQAGEELSPDKIELSEICWRGALSCVLGFAKTMNSLGLHKQIVNRMLEPWSHINVVVSATSFDNFFCLRIEKSAQPEIQKLAFLMAVAMRDSSPIELQEGEWHLPYVLAEEKENFPIQDLIKFSVARCCRVSYLTMEGKTADPLKDLILHDQLLEDKHFSPFEHVAQATSDPFMHSGNFSGWLQYRKMLINEAYEKFDYGILQNFEEKNFKVN